MGVVDTRPSRPSIYVRAVSVLALQTTSIKSQIKNATWERLYSYCTILPQPAFLRTNHHLNEQPELTTATHSILHDVSLFKNYICEIELSEGVT